jgi:hypothetical protein
VNGTPWFLCGLFVWVYKKWMVVMSCVFAGRVYQISYSYFLVDSSVLWSVGSCHLIMGIIFQSSNGLVFSIWYLYNSRDSLTSLMIYTDFLSFLSEQDLCLGKTSSILLDKSGRQRAGEKTQWLRALATLPGHPGSIPSTHMAAPIGKSSPRGSDALFWHPRTLHACGTHIHAHKTLIHIK